MKSQFKPRLIAWEVTRSCNMNCVHCRAAASRGPYKNELETEECFRFLDDVASFSEPIMILTGGEPMLRADIFDIAEYGTRLGLTMVMAPCGNLLDEESLERMKTTGIRRISLSIDGATAESHDKFRQVPGAFDSVIRAARLAYESGVEFQINTVVSRSNIDELEEIYKLTLDLKAVSWHPFMLVPTGRGAEIFDMEITPEEYERVLNRFYDIRREGKLHVKVTCGPHYYRIMRERALADGVPVTSETFGMDAVTKGCMGGQSFAFVSHTGVVQICGYLDIPCGNIREEPFSSIWAGNPVFDRIRDLNNYKGKCGICEYRRVCGGCRARAYAFTGDYLASEPYCVYEPGGRSDSVS